MTLTPNNIREIANRIAREGWVIAGDALRKHADELERTTAQPKPDQPTLRDWLAMHASEEDIQEFIPQTVGEQERRFKQDGIRRTRTWARYQAADAMLAARKGVQL